MANRKVALNWQRPRLRVGPLLIVIGALVVVALSAPLLVMKGRPPVPEYLDARDPTVDAALAGSTSQDEFLARLLARTTALYPPEDEIWSVESGGYDRPATRSLWDDGRQVVFGSAAPFAVPENPTWAENPHHDLTWLRDYHSLRWLNIPASAYLATGDTRYRDQVKFYLLDWIADNPRGRGAPSERSWFDGAVGYRTDLVVDLFAPVLADALTPAEFGVLLGSLELHGRLLDRYLSMPGLAGHNHNLFHALSLYSLANAFPQLEQADQWRSDARQRISTLMPEMVDVDEGVSLEQAASYHMLAIRLFGRADEYLSQFGDGLSDAEMATLSRMAAFAALLMTPDGDLPAIGDTAYGTDGRQALAQLKQRGITNPFADFALSRGAEGTEPPDASFFPRSGYAIMRPNYSRGDAWERDLQLIVDTSPQMRDHGHNDVMNVLLTAFGNALLVDSGGPYAYGDEGRDAFVDAIGHNVVVVDGGATAPGPARNLVETDDDRHSVVAATYGAAEGVDDRRTVILLKPSTVVIVDRLTPLDDASHDYELLYHLPPEATVSQPADLPAGPNTESGVVDAGSASMGYTVTSSDHMSAEVVEGRSDPALGWVTEGHLQRTPAPVLSFREQAGEAWFATALSAAPAGAGQAPTVSVREIGDRLEVTVTAGRDSATIELAADGSVSLVDCTC
jgi:heparinase II/III-like protein